MKVIASVATLIAIVSLILGIISRLTLTPVSFIPGGVFASTLLEFTNTCLLLAIALSVLAIAGNKR